MEPVDPIDPIDPAAPIQPEPDEAQAEGDVGNGDPPKP